MKTIDGFKVGWRRPVDLPDPDEDPREHAVEVRVIVTWPVSQDGDTSYLGRNPVDRELLERGVTEAAAQAFKQIDEKLGA